MTSYLISPYGHPANASSRTLAELNSASLLPFQLLYCKSSQSHDFYSKSDLFVFKSFPPPPLVFKSFPPPSHSGSSPAGSSSQYFASLFLLHNPYHPVLI